MIRKMVHFTESIQTLISDRNIKVKAHESIERLLTYKYISNGNLWLLVSTWYRSLQRDRGYCLGTGMAN
jgi:hypothetical protein